MDLSILAQQDTWDMPVRHPATRAPLKHEDGRPVTVTLRNPESKAYKDRQRVRANELLAEAEGSRRVFETAEDQERAQTGVLVDGIAGWNIVIDGATPNADDASHVARVLDDSRFGWLRQDIDRALARRANFIKGLSEG